MTRRRRMSSKVYSMKEEDILDSEMVRRPSITHHQLKQAVQKRMTSESEIDELRYGAEMTIIEDDSSNNGDARKGHTLTDNASPDGASLPAITIGDVETGYTNPAFEKDAKDDDKVAEDEALNDLDNAIDNVQLARSFSTQH